MKVHKSVMVPYSVVEMYSIVENINGYPEFLPWCAHTEILHQEPISIGIDYRRTARIHIQHFGLKSQFTTANLCSPVGVDGNASIKVLPASADDMKDDPFQDVQGVWLFTKVGDMGSKIAVDMEYQFKNVMVEKLFGKLFAGIIEGFAQSFVKRAHHLYGNSHALR